MVSSSVLPPLLPRVDAILVLDGDGNRLAGKYYGDFLTNTTSSSSRAAMKESEENKDKEGTKTGGGITVEDLRASFERQLQAKIQGIAARSDAAEVVTVMGKTAVFCGGMAVGATPSGTGGDVRVVHVGPARESELLLAHLCEGMYDALSNLMGGQTDRSMILDNLELVFLLIDEHCDGGFILEVDGNKLASCVLLRDDEDTAAMGGGADGMTNGDSAAMPAASGLGGFNQRNMGDISIAQAFRQAKQQFMAGMQSDGM